MAAGGRHFQRPLGAFLALDVGKVRQVARRHLDAGFGARQHLRAAEMIGDRNQAARRQDVEILAGPGRLRPAGKQADQSLALALAPIAAGYALVRTGACHNPLSASARSTSPRAG